MNTARVLPAVLAVSLIFAPLAHASPATNYDQYMISHGEVDDGSICAGHPCGYSLEYLLQQGKNACAAFAQGMSDSSLTVQLEGGPGPYHQGLDEATTSNIVVAAHNYLCSDA
jgi:hypothetical protein